MTGIIRAERVAFRYLSMITACGPPRLEARWADRYLSLGLRALAKAHWLTA